MKLKTPPGPFFLHHSSGGWDGGREGCAWTGFPWIEPPFSIFRIPVFCAESQKEINLTLKHWRLHLFMKDVRCCLNDYANSSKPTCSWHSVPLHLLFFFGGGGSSSQTHDWIRPVWERISQDKDLSTWKSCLLLDRIPEVAPKTEQWKTLNKEWKGTKICRKHFEVE